MKGEKVKGETVKVASMRPALFVLLGLLLSAPTLANIINGDDSAMGAGEHLAAAILVAWLAVGLVGHVVDSYRAATLRREHLEDQQSHQP